MGVKVTNNAFGTLSAGISTSDTTITLDSGQGARFPTLSSGDYFYGTVVDTSNNLEIVKVTARSSDSMTVVRAQDNTTATAFAIGDRFELRPVAALFEDITDNAEVVNDTSPTLGGNLDADSNSITNVGGITVNDSSTIRVREFHSNADDTEAKWTNNDNESSQGVGIIQWGKDQGGGFEGDIHYIADSQGASGQHKFYTWNGSSWTNKVSIDENGITFDAGSNYLDDYEEGTWTPEIYGTTTAGSWSPGTNNGGRYTKVGNQVTAWMNAIGTLSGAGGSMRVRTLPFANSQSISGAKNAAYSVGSMQYWAGPSVMVNGPLMPLGVTYIYFHTYTTTSTAGGSPGVVNGSHNLHCFITYYVS